MFSNWTTNELTQTRLHDILEIFLSPTKCFIMFNLLYFQTTHPIEKLQTLIKSKPSTATCTAAPQIGGQARQASIDNYCQNQTPFPATGTRAEAITTAIAIHLIADMKPLSTVDGLGFKYMMHVTEPRYKVVSRNHLLERHIIPMYQNHVEIVKGDLSKAVRHAFTTDAWTSASMDSYITTTCHYIDPATFELQSKVLDTKSAAFSHTAENLAMDMEMTSTKWGFKDPVSVTDNASNIVLACEHAKYPHIGCFAHTLNLAVSKCMNVSEVSFLVGKCRKLVSVFKQSYLKTMSLHNAQAVLEIKQLQVLQDVETRWNSALIMIRRILQIYPAIYATLYTDKKHQHLLPSDSELHALDDLKQLLTPIEDATKRISSEKKPTASYILPML